MMKVQEQHFHFARYRRLIPRAGFDALIVLSAYILVYLVVPERIFLEPEQNTWFIIGTAVLMVGSLFFFRVYQRIWSRTSGYGIVTIINAVTIPTLLLAIIVVIINPRPLSLATVLFGNLLSMVGFIGVRYRSRLISGFAARWHYLFTKDKTDLRTKTLIVGAGQAGQILALRLKHGLQPQQYHIIGFVDDDSSKHHMYVEGSPVLGGRQVIPQIVNRHNVELIIVAIHNIPGTDFRAILQYCEQTSARIKVVPDIISQMSMTKRAPQLRDVQVEDLLGRGAIARHESVDLSTISHKRILITGAAGSIGSELSRQIMGYEPEHVILLDNNESGLFDLSIELASRQVRITSVLADITQRDNIRSVFEQYHPEIVFHAAAYKHVPMLEEYPDEALRVNIQGTRNIAEIACDYLVERFVLISTDKAVNPSSVMGATKRVCELMLHAIFNTDQCKTLLTSVRFGNVLGSRGSVVPTFNRQIDQGGPVTVTHPDMTRYFMTIPEAVNLIMHAAALTQGDDIFILQMGEVVRIVELAERLIRLRGLRPNHDIAIEYTGVRPGEKMHEELYTQAEHPEPTLHPYIIKLNTWHEDFVGEEFWRKLDRLSCVAIVAQTRIIDQLREVIETDLLISQRLA